MSSVTGHTALVTDPDESDFQEEAYNIGAQIDFQFQVSRSTDRSPP